MARMRKKVLCYALRRNKEYSYWHQVLTIFYAREESLRALLEGTVDNKAGYGSEEAARRLNLWFTQLLKEGYDRVLRRLSHGPIPTIHVDWMEIEARREYSAGYGQADIKLGDQGLRATLNGARFIKGLATRIVRHEHESDEEWTFSERDLTDRVINDPAVVTAMVQQMGGRQVKSAKGELRYHTEWVYDPGPRPWTYTDTLWRTFRLT